MRRSLPAVTWCWCAIVRIWSMTCSRVGGQSPRRKVLRVTTHCVRTQFRRRSLVQPVIWHAPGLLLSWPDMTEPASAPVFDAKAFLRTVPEEPVVYRMIGVDDKVLYVGKAKNLRRRVSNYFQRTQPSPRIAL